MLESGDMGHYEREALGPHVAAAASLVVPMLSVDPRRLTKADIRSGVFQRNMLSGLLFALIGAALYALSKM
jgi:hypothetical protein